jgi:small conductance mechanosensitive channel
MGQALKRAWRCLPILAASLLAFAPAQAQDAGEPAEAASAEAAGELIELSAADAQLAERVSRILDATGWFSEVSVRVESGVVFLDGLADLAEHRERAEELVSSLEGVAAVVNELGVGQSTVWDLTPAWEQLADLGNAAIRHSPMVLLALVLLALTIFATRMAMRGSHALLGRHVNSKLLRDVAARTIAVPVFLLGLYIVLSVSGLTGLAVTVIGSTGLIGLVLGFAFRDIAENFLASILISMNKPFRTGDRIDVAGHHGFVQSVNSRSTLLMTLEGNHVQIPNALIYKGTITNFTANPKARFDFTIGIGYEDSIVRAQETALEVLRAHPAVIDDPESLVLVEALGSSTVNLRVYFWIDVSKYSHNKVRSGVIREIKVAFERAGISMPDEAREVVFPHGVPVVMSEQAPDAAAAAAARSRTAAEAAEEDTIDAAAEDYSSEAEDIERQARESRNPEGGANLLES